MNGMQTKQGVANFKKSIQRKQWIDYDTLYKLYIIDGRSVSDISKMYNKKNYQVSYYLDKFNIHKDRKQIYQTTKQTNLKKYGVDNIMKSAVGKESYRNTMINTYGERYSKDVRLSSKENVIKEINIITDKLGRKPTFFEITNHFNITHPTMSVILKEYNLRSYIDFETSRLENTFECFLDTFNVDYIKHCRSLIHPYEIDFYVPSIKVGFEINDIASHSSSGNETFFGFKSVTYHQDKSLMCREKGIQLIHIYEWQLCDKSYMSKLSNNINIKLGRCDRVYARNCQIKQVDWQTARNFYNSYHIQNSGTKSNINYGLYYNDELVEVMSFGKSRFSNKYDFELLRLCTKSNVIVIGGASKLFKHFLKQYTPGTIVSYCDLDNMSGGVYPKLGFTFDGYTSPTYVWCNNDLQVYNWKVILDRGVDNVLGTNYGKGVSNSKIMVDSGYYRVYNSGNIRFLYKKCN